MIRSYYQVAKSILVKPNPGATPTPKEELLPSEPFAVIEFDDPSLLKKAFKALADLGVEIPRKLAASINERQERLSATGE